MIVSISWRRAARRMTRSVESPGWKETVASASAIRAAWSAPRPDRATIRRRVPGRNAPVSKPTSCPAPRAALAIDLAALKIHSASRLETWCKSVISTMDPFSEVDSSRFPTDLKSSSWWRSCSWNDGSSPRRSRGTTAGRATTQPPSRVLDRTILNPSGSAVRSQTGPSS